MSPECGTLNPGAKCLVKVIFMPEVAGVHYATATCWFGGEVKQQRTIMLKALGESFLYLTLKEMCIAPFPGIAFHRDTWRACTLRLCCAWLNPVMRKQSPRFESGLWNSLVYFCQFGSVI